MNKVTRWDEGAYVVRVFLAASTTWNLTGGCSGVGAGALAVTCAVLKAVRLLTAGDQAPGLVLLVGKTSQPMMFFANKQQFWEYTFQWHRATILEAPMVQL